MKLLQNWKFFGYLIDRGRGRNMGFLTHPPITNSLKKIYPSEVQNSQQADCGYDGSTCRELLQLDFSFIGD